MALTNSQPNNINVPNGNGLVVFIDGETNQVYVRDVRGATEELNVLTESITTIIAEGGLTALKVGSVVTLGTDSSIIQLKAEKGQPNGYASLDADGKLPVSQLPVSVLTYEGMWNASTNTPFIQDGVGNAGDFYIVSVAGTQDLGSGPIRFEVGDWVIYNGSIWQRNSSELPDLQEVTDVGAVTTNAITTGGITTDYVQLDTTATPTLAVGMARWNTNQLTWEVGIGTGPIAYELGQSLYYPQVRNTSGTNLPKGTLVMVDPTDVSTGDRLNVIRAVANGTYISQLFVGILAEAINSNATGFAVWFGQVYNVANSAINLGGETWAEGDILYASAANPGGLTKVEPTAPNLKVTIAAIQAINGGNVNLLVRPWLNEDLGALNDVAITSPIDNSILQFNSSTGVWENVAGTTTNIAEGTNLYFTTARARESVSAGDGISYDSGTGVITNSDKGSSQDIFKNIAVATQSTITADSNNDTLTLAAGTNIGITTNASTDTITFSTVGVPTGTGVSNYVALWSSASNLTTSLIYDTGSAIGIGTTTPQAIFATNVTDSSFNFEARRTTIINNGTTVGAIGFRGSVGGLVATAASIYGEAENTWDIGAGTISSGLAINVVSSGAQTQRFKLLSTGKIVVSGYGSGTFTGTPAYNLFVDASGNIIEGPGGVIDGSGTTNYISKFTDSNTIGNSIIFDNGTNVGIGTTTLVSDAGYTIVTVGGANGAAVYLTGAAENIGILNSAGTLEFKYRSGGVNFIAPGGTRMQLGSVGNFTLNAYGSGSWTGTAAYNLAVDANGNIIETAGAVIDGSGTTNYVAKFTDSNTIGDSQIFDNGTNVGIGTNTPSQLLHVAGAARITGSLYDSTNDPGAVTEFLSSTGSGTAWTTAVTSVAFTVPTGFAIANSPITTSGTLGLTFAAGYSLPTDARQTEWDTAYNNSITAFAYNTGTGVLTLTQQDLGTLTATVTLQPFTTTNLAEGTNLYYTDARARLALSAGTGISYDNSTGVITNSDRGSSQFIFKNVAVTGSDLIVADSNDDTITFTAGSGVTLSSNASTDTITISATGLGGTVTSVGLTAPTGFTVSGSPITTSGTLSIGFDTGYSLPTTAKQANWDDAYDNKITAASFSSATGTLTLTQQDTGTLTTNFDGRYILLSEKGANNGVATLDAGGKIPASQLPSSVFEYKGTWNASTNTPTLVDGVGDPGDVYLVSVAGTHDFGDGPISFAVGDLVLYDGTEWQKSSSTNDVVSVNGQTGVVVLTTTNINEGTNLYFTDARARSAISGGSGITYNSTNGTITNADPGSSQAIFKNIEVAGQSTVTAEINNDTLTLVAGTNISITTNASTDTITINATDQYAGTVTSVAMSVPTGFTISGSPITSAGTLGLAFASGYSLPTDSVQANWTTAYNRSLTAFAYNTSTGVLTLTEQDASTLTATITLQPFTTTNLAEGTNLYFTDARARGAISLTTTGTSGAATYNSSTGVLNIPQYQSAITNPVTGTGTTNYVAKWSSSSAITDSLIFDNGTNVGIGNTSPGQKLDITGNARVSSYYLFNGNPGNPGDSTASIYDQAGVGPTISGLNVAFRTGSTPAETMRITDGGNVGIGLTGPSYKLSINGSAGIEASEEYFYFNSNYSVGSNARAKIRGVGAGGGSGYGGDFRISTRATNNTWNEDAVTVNYAGNVGIGTTAPAAKFQVTDASSSITLQNYLDGAAIFLDGVNGDFVGGDYFHILADGSSYLGVGGYAGGTTPLNVTNAGNVGIGTTNPSYKTSVVAANGNYWNGTAFTGTPLALSIENSQAGGYDPVLIYNQADSAGTLKNSGAIGMVGTAAWTAGDDAAQVSDMYFLVRNSSGALQERARLKSNGHLILKSATSGGGTQGDFYVIENGGLVIDASEGATQRYIEFTTGGTSKALLTAGGNFLIGTTTDAGQKLQVSGQSSLKLGSGTTQQTIVTFDNATNGAYLSVVGIGTTSVVGTWTNGSMVLEAVPFSTGSFILGAYTGSTIIQNGRVNRVEVSSAGAVRFNNYGSGSFTGTVAYNLAVDASGNIIETAGGVVDGSGTANYVTKWQDANTVTNSIIRDDGTTVGVGTAPAAAKLTVDGSITAGGQTNYGKSYGSIDTTGQAVAGLIASTNGQGSMFTFTCRGGGGEYQRVVYSCYNDGGTWYTNKVIDEGTNALDVTASANGATITFTFKARSTTQAYTPAVLVQQFGSAIDTSYL